MNEVLDLEAGLILLRHVALRNGHHDAVITLDVPPGDADFVDLLYDPSVTAEALLAPNQCVVIRCRRRAKIVVSARNNHGGHPKGSVKLEYLTRYRRAGSAAVPLRGEPLDSLQVTAHLGHRGDLAFANGAWIGGPDAPSRIEGLTLDWPDIPPDLIIRYGNPTGALVTIGSYVGTRGRHRSLDGIALRLEGPAASGYRLDVDALFALDGRQSDGGTEVMVRSTKSNDLLIGLRIALSHDERSGVPRSTAPAWSLQPRQNRRLRIFRG